MQTESARATRRANVMRAMEFVPGSASAPTPAPVLPSSTSQHSASRTLYVPESIAESFVKVKERDYYHSDGEHAFRVRGLSLSMRGHDRSVIDAWTEVMRANDVRLVEVSGSQQFRERAWAAAVEAGIAVKGHSPSDFEQAKHAEALTRLQLRSQTDAIQPAVRRAASMQPSQLQDKPRPQIDSTLYIGRLVAHGRAPHHHEPNGLSSYYLTLETARGEKTFWSTDLEPAVRQSTTQPQIGNTVGVRQLPHYEFAMDAQAILRGELPSQFSSTAERWVVEKREFFAARESAAKVLRDHDVPANQGSAKHPDLATAYDVLGVAAVAARRDLGDEQARRQFVDAIREVLAHRIARGDPIPKLPQTRTQSQAARRAPLTLNREAPVRG